MTRLQCRNDGCRCEAHIDTDTHIPACMWCNQPLLRAEADPRAGICPKHSRTLQTAHTWTWLPKDVLDGRDYAPQNGWQPIDLTGVETSAI